MLDICLAVFCIEVRQSLKALQLFISLGAVGLSVSMTGLFNVLKAAASSSSSRIMSITMVLSQGDTGTSTISH
ncbi:hypothetical protein D3C71_1750250 [compost metagenome]